MRNLIFFFLLIIPPFTLYLIAGNNSSKDVSYKISLGKVYHTAVFHDSPHGMYSVWGASVVQDDDGLFHMYYSRWPKHLGWAWLTDSEIAHAVSESITGPWRFVDVALKRRGKEFWDGWCTHNPTIHKFDGKYYLYYMGNTGDGKVMDTPQKEVLNWSHRNNQRIGVAVSDSPYGPWMRSDKPLIDISANDDDYDCLMTSNPSLCQMPDGRYLMIYKAVGKKFPLPQGGSVVHLAAISDSPTGPFKKFSKLVFHFEGERFPAEDPYIWYQDGKFRAIVKRMETAKNGCSLMQFESDNGLDWKKSEHFIVSGLNVTFEDGSIVKLSHLERPQVYLHNGEAGYILCAADSIDSNNVRQSFNLQIPLIIEKNVSTF